MNERRNILQESLAAIERLQSRLNASEAKLHQPIAIVGAGCRYPGGAESPEALWKLVRDGVNAVAEVPRDRWDIDAYYDPNPNAPGKMVTRRGGFLSQVDQFDAQFFGISPREATTLDPQQRLLLETAYEALESAGIAVDRLAGSLTGVFVGITTSDYGGLLRAGTSPESSDVYSATGSALNAAAGRIAFTFGLQGPCVSIDTACSSSLVATHMACQSLRTGESDLALAGGVNVVLAPEAMVLFSKWGMMAPDGACKTFDAAADGFVRAEGCAVIALKRLSDALAAGDPILALIRGSAVNSDGRSSGLTVPSGLAQQAVLRSALANARLAPSDIDYVEAHGTGTPLGDPIEVEALGAVMGEGRSAERSLVIGSVKTNLGHTEAASGLAGLLKTALALRNETIPPHLHFRTPNPGIPWSDLLLTVPTAALPWRRRETARRAGISSFGFSGTNAHVIIEEPPAQAPAAAAADRPYLLPLAARSESALKEMAARLAARLAGPDAPGLNDTATTLALGRSALPRRAAVVVSSAEQAVVDLRAMASGARPASSSEGLAIAGQMPKIAFLFTGQGTQYPGMGRDLYQQEPVFREVIDRADAVLTRLLGRSFNDLLFGTDAAALAQTAVTQPALFAIEFALTELWRSWGITPSIVTGHSVGEYTAACVAGVFSFEEGLSLVAERGRLMQALPPGGAMAAIFASESRVAETIAAIGPGVSIAAVNGPEEIVVSGDAVLINELLEDLARAGVKGRRLDVSHAFHSARLDPMLDALERRAAAVSHTKPQITLISNLTGAAFAAGTGPDARYWRRHAREPVQFAAGVAALQAAGVTILLEAGPHPTLLALAARAVPGASWGTAASLRRGQDERREMLASLGALYVRGASVRWDAVLAGSGGRRVSLPTYPFQRERFWVDRAAAAPRRAARAGHPILGSGQELASAPGTHVWEQEISLEALPWLADHRVQGAAIVPATAYIEMALAAGREVLGAGSLSVREIENLKPIILQPRDLHRVQATLTTEADGSARFVVYGRRTSPDGAAAAPWILHMKARLARVASSKSGESSLDAVRAAQERCATPLAGSAFYEALARKGNQWGPSFRGMQQVWRGEDEAIARVEVAAALADEVSRYQFHPAVSDSCGHALVATTSMVASDDARGGAFVGGGVGEVRFHRSPVGRNLWARAKLRPSADGNSNLLIGDVWVHDEDGALVSETLDARLWYLDEDARAAQLGVPPEWYYEPVWQPADPVALSEADAPAGPWLLFADESGVAEQIAALRRAAGHEVHLVYRGESWSASGNRFTMRAANAEDYERLLAAVPAPVAVLHLWSLDSPRASDTTDPIAAGLIRGPESVLHLLHAVRHAASARRPRLWLVTSGTQFVTDGDRCDAPWSATLWGLGRALAVEHTELWGGLMDLPSPCIPHEEAQRILQELAAARREDKVAWRAGSRFVARLARRRARGRRPLVVRADRTYVITGGLGGIGLAMAGWLVDQGARHLLLLGRTPLPPRERWSQPSATSADGQRIASVQRMEKLGARVISIAADVADGDAIRGCLAQLSAAGAPEVAGVIHAAGILQFEPLESQSVASLREGLAAKVFGAWHLHALLAHVPLDWFVLCSSSSSLLRSPLLGGYAAANAFLDSFAHHLRSEGRAALSINWGTWGQVGMAVASGGNAPGRMLAGVDTLSTAHGLAALRELLEAGDVQTLVMPVNWADLARSYPAFAADPFFERQVSSADLHSETQAGSLPRRDVLRTMAPADRAEVLGGYIRAQAEHVLGFASGKLDDAVPLSSLGFDSLMAVQLKNRVEADLGVTAPMIEFLQGPSAQRLTATIMEALASVLAEPQDLADGAAAAQVVWEEGSL